MTMPDTSKIPYAYRRLGMGIERTPFQEDVARVADKAAGVLATGGAAAVDIASGAGSYFLGTPKTELYKGLRIPSPVLPSEATQPTPAAPARTAPPITPTGVAAPVPAAAKPHPAAGTKDLWEYASTLPPDRLKAFVDKNQGVEGFEGIGYVETKDPRTGKMRVEPTISRPAPPLGLTAKQLTAAGHYQQGLGVREQAAATREYNAELIRQRVADTDMKNINNYMDQAKKVAPIEDVDELINGKLVASKQPNIEKGIEILRQSGYPVPKGIKAPGVATLESKAIPKGAQTGTYKGKRAYLLNGKYYDLATGTEMK